MTSSLLIVLLFGAALSVQGSVIDRAEQAQGIEDIEQDLYDEYYAASPVDMDQYDFEETENDDDYMYDPEQDDIDETDMTEITSDVERMLGGPIKGRCRGSLTSGLSCSVCVSVQKKFRGRNLKAKFCANVRIQKKTVKVYLNGKRIFQRRFSVVTLWQ